MAGTTQKKGLKVNEALSKALEGASEPMKAKDIIDGALPLTNLSTKTPRATIAHALSVEARKADGLFERTGPGLYRLREKKAEAAAITTSEAKPDPKPEKKPRSTRSRGGRARQKQPAAAA